jgi:choline-sulfatase
MKKTNILILVTDQLSQRAVGAYGNKDSETSAIDNIAANGIRFSNAYTPCPLCCPARASFWTGLLPHDTQVESNGNRSGTDWVQEDVNEGIPTLGSIFNKNGYECIHFGKTHDAGTLRGFYIEPEKELELEGSAAWPVNYDSRRDEYTVKKSVEYLNKKHDKPFLMVADIQNPHDICNWIGKFKGKPENITGPGKLPELLDNFDNKDWENRPIPIQYICCSHRRMQQASQWDENNYRHYLAAYYHYVKRADNCIRKILDALKKSGEMDNTLIVFLSDHGDGMGAHRMVTKQVSFIEETARIPLIFSGPGITPRGTMNSDQLVSLDDLLPSLCDYAELPVPEGIYGKSLMPYLRSSSKNKLRDYVVSEWTTEWGFTVSPGRMLRTDRYKYIRYLEGNGEELFDLQNDPGERHSLIKDPKFQEVLAEHRKLLLEHIKKSNDNFFERNVKVHSRWRSHCPGYQHHLGSSAPEQKSR